MNSPPTRRQQYIQEVRRLRENNESLQKLLKHGFILFVFHFFVSTTIILLPKLTVIYSQKLFMLIWIATNFVTAVCFIIIVIKWSPIKEYE